VTFSIFFFLLIAEAKQKEWDNIATCHAHDNGVRTWEYAKKSLGKHVLKPTDGTACTVRFIQVLFLDDFIQC